MNPPKILGQVVAIAAIVLLLGLVAMMIRDGIEHRDDSKHAARQAQCFNNLKQIGLSIAQYSRMGEQSLGPYPQGTISNPDIPLERRTGWASLIFKLGDEGCSGCEEIYPGPAWDDPMQKGGAGLDQEMYCPEHPRQGKNQRLLPADYVGIAGLGVDAPSLPTTDKRAGIFGDDRLVGPVDVTDGLATTMMVVDSTVSPGPWFAGGRNTVRGLDPSRQPYIGKGQQFGGTHAGGANVLMADGSVHFVKDSVAPKVFEALSTIAGGEKVSVP
jgi:prepilin-type processing-associated H-X9-DG protein